MSKINYFVKDTPDTNPASSTREGTEDINRDAANVK